MNDPKVVALIYLVEHEKTKCFDKVKPLRYRRSPEFDLTVKDNIARFKFKKFYANVTEALEVVNPFIQQWEFEVDMEGESGFFRLMYEKAEIIDQNPLLPELRPAPLQVGGEAVLPGLTGSASVVLAFPHYPPPPAGGSVDLDDSCVVKMKNKYDQYRLGRTTLTDAASFCVDVLKEKYKSRPAAAKACGISRKILDKIGNLTSNKGGNEARKAIGADIEYTNQERRFLRAALKEIIIRAAQVAADDSQRCPKITMANLQKL